jgi:hypothetical protein
VTAFFGVVQDFKLTGDVPQFNSSHHDPPRLKFMVLAKVVNRGRAFNNLKLNLKAPDRPLDTRRAVPLV